MKRILIKQLLFFFLFFFFFGCKSKHVRKVENKNSITFLSNDFTNVLYNQDKSLLLILKYKDDGNIPITFNYKVINVMSKNVEKEGVFIGQKIEWSDNTSLKCFQHIGIIREENPRLLTIEKPKNYIIIKIYSN